MNRSKFTVLLLLVNLGLVLAVVHFYRQARRPDSAGTENLGAPLPPGSPRATGAPAVRIVKTNILDAPFRWSQIESDDYRAYIQRLRAIGVPEQTIRDLIIADIDKLFAPQLHALNPTARELKFWQTDDKELETSADFRERQRQLHVIDFQKRDLLRQLLGIDLVSERTKLQGTEDLSGRRLGFLPDDKRGQVRTIIDQFNDAELAIRQKTWEEGESLTDEDQTRLKQFQQQRETAIAGVLNPSELEQYQLALSPLAYQVRESLFGMNPTEQEFTALYKLQKAFADKWPPDAAPADPQQRAEWEQAQAELQVIIKEQLGEQRYAQYQRAQDADYRQLAIAAARYKLPATVAGEVYDYKKIVQEARARVVGNRSLTPDQQQAAAQAIATETEQTVKAALGDQAFNYYLRSGQGTWIRAGE